MMKSWKAATKWVAAMAGGAVLVTAAVGLLHTSAGRPLLSKLGGEGEGAGCPVKSQDAVTAKDFDALRTMSTDRLRGAIPAPRRPALGFELDGMKLADVLAWAARHDRTCERKDKDTTLICAHVLAKEIGEPESAPPIDLLTFGFTSEGALVSVSAARSGLSGKNASSLVEAAYRGLERDLGKPTQETGESSPEYLEAEMLRSRLAVYSFKDYRAEVTAVHTPSGIYVRERYLSMN
jgi:hypothetical protein